MNHIIEGFQILAVKKALGSVEYQGLIIFPVQFSAKLPRIVMMRCPSSDSEQGESRLCKIMQGANYSKFEVAKVCIVNNIQSER